MSQKFNVLYLCSGRSFFSNRLSRKIGEVVTAFKEHAEVNVICGGDVMIQGSMQQYTPPAVSVPIAKYGFRAFLRNSGSEWRSLSADSRLLRKAVALGLGFNLIIERSAAMHTAGLRFARRRHLPYVLEWKDHLLDYRWSLLKWYGKILESRKIKLADWIFVESQVLKNQLSKQYGHPEKFFVTYNAVNPNEFVKSLEHRQEVRDQFGFTPEDLVIGYCGSYAFYHDSLRMILAAEILKNEGINSVKWLLVGSGRDYELCRKAAEEKDLLNKTVFMVPRVPKEEVPTYLSAFDLAILPGSTDIICPIKVMEYMASETVVLLPDYPCNREVVTENTGILFQPFSERSIADSIHSLLGKPERLLKLSHNARIRVKENFTWDKTYGAALKQILDLITKDEDFN